MNRATELLSYSGENMRDWSTQARKIIPKKGTNLLPSQGVNTEEK